MANSSVGVTRRIAIGTLAAAVATSKFAKADTKLLRLSAKTLTGETLDAASLKGKPVLVQFWATWCTYCQSDEGAVESIVQKLSPKGLIVLGVNAYEPRLKVQEYLQKHPRACKIALLEETNLAPLLTGRSYPVYVLFDRGGSVIETQRGALGELSLRRLVARVGL